MCKSVGISEKLDNVGTAPECRFTIIRSIGIILNVLLKKGNIQFEPGTSN